MHDRIVFHSPTGKRFGICNYEMEGIYVLSVGKTIDAYCTKCKLVLTHVVLFEVGEGVKRVECKTCHSQHQYRPAAPGSKPRDQKKSSRTPRQKKASSDAGKSPNEALLLWEIKRRELDPARPVREYHMQDQYRAGEVISHATFGLGFVERITSDKTMLVLFQGAEKVMAMNRPA